jgi:hypothetical protein
MGIADNPGWSQIQVFDQRGQVGDIFADAALAWRPLALAVATPIVGDNAE